MNPLIQNDGLEDELYKFAAYVPEDKLVYDGDTFRANVDLGFYIEKKELQFRMKGIDTPELRGDEYEDGIVSRDRFRELIVGKPLILKTSKTGKYGRWIAEVKVIGGVESYDEDKTINKILLEEDLAESYE